jgi:hypothetical protein
VQQKYRYKKGDRKKRKRKRERDREREAEKKVETSKSGGDYRHLFFTRKGKEKRKNKETKDNLSCDIRSVQRSERQ